MGKDFGWQKSGSGSGNCDYSAQGYSETLGKNVDVNDCTEAFNELFDIQDQSPLVSLSVSPAAYLREFGDTIASVDLTANTTKRTNPITSVIFRRNGIIIEDVASPNPNGGTEAYTDNNPVSSDTTYNVTVSDGTLSDSKSIAYRFVYPFYWGVGAKNLTPAQIQALTKRIEQKSNKTVTTSPNNEVYYFAYPASYGQLTSILDPNNFETIGDYTLRTENFTMLDGSTVQYYVYEFNNLTSQNNFTIQYIF